MLDLPVPRGIVVPPDGDLDDSWWAPLEAVTKVARADPRYRFFDIDDFQLMYKQVRRGRADLVMYRHFYIRRYLNLDHAGHAYRFVCPRPPSTAPCRYLHHRSLRDALDHLDLWELPWLKPALAEHRLGLTWSERWALHPDAAEWGM